MILKRTEAVALSSFIAFINLSAASLKIVTEYALAELGLESANEEIGNYHTRKYIEYEFKYVSNAYLKSLLSAHFNTPVEISGKTPKLYPCPCCAYKTLKLRGEYFICRVCYWEDDGSGSDLNIYSNANHMTLAEAKMNWEKTGLVIDNLANIERIDQQRFLKYSR